MNIIFEVKCPHIFVLFWDKGTAIQECLVGDELDRIVWKMWWVNIIIRGVVGNVQQQNIFDA